MGGAVSTPCISSSIQKYFDISLFGYTVPFTNSALWMVMATTFMTALLLYSMQKASLVPSRLQSFGEITYEFVANMVRQNAGNAGMKYFPVIFTIFMFVLSLNMLGMIPLPGLGAVYRHEPHYYHLRACGFRLHRRDAHRHLQAWLRLP